MSRDVPLWEKMLVLANSGHARAEDLRSLSAAFEHAFDGFYGTPQKIDAKRFLGCWARARRCWSECSGEPLV